MIIHKKSLTTTKNTLIVYIMNDGSGAGELVTRWTRHRWRVHCRVFHFCDEFITLSFRVAHTVV